MASAESAETLRRPVSLARGLLYALLMLPVAVILFAVASGFGLPSWVVAFVAAVLGLLIGGGTAWLYRAGSGGPVPIAGRIVILAVAEVSLYSGFVAGLVSFWLHRISTEVGLSPTQTLAAPNFWLTFGRVFNTLAQDNLVGLLIGSLLAGAMIVQVLRHPSRRSAPQGDPDPDNLVI